MRRHELTGADWARLKELLPPDRGRPGRPAELSNRRFMDGSSSSRKPVYLGATCPSASALGRPFTAASLVGTNRVCSHGCWMLWQLTRITSRVWPTQPV